MRFFLIFALIHLFPHCFSQNSSLPEYLNPCKAGPQLDDCVVQNGQAAIQRLIHDDDSVSDSIELNSLEIGDVENDDDFGSNDSEMYDATYETDEAVSNERSAYEPDSYQDEDSDYDPELDSTKKGKKTKKKKKLRIRKKKNGLNINMKGFKLSGLKAIKFSSSKTNLQKKIAEWTFSVSKLEIRCKYKITGKAILIPVRATGHAKITLTGVKFTYVFNWSKSKKKGYNVLKMGKSRMKYSVKKVQVQLNNLRGSQVLAKQAADQVENDVQETVDDDLGPQMMDSFNGYVTSTVEELTNDVPYERIFVE